MTRMSLYFCLANSKSRDTLRLQSVLARLGLGNVHKVSSPAYLERRLCSQRIFNARNSHKHLRVVFILGRGGICPTLQNVGIAMIRMFYYWENRQKLKRCIKIKRKLWKVHERFGGSHWRWSLKFEPFLWPRNHYIRVEKEATGDFEPYL